MRKFKNRYTNSVYWVAAFSGAIIFSAALLFGILAATGNYSTAQMQLESAYQRSFFEMADSVSEIELNLSKMLVSSSEEQTIETCEEIRLQALMAQNSINQLPLSQQTAHDMNKFLNQVGDWCASYTHALLTQGEASVYEERVEEIYTVARNLNVEIEEISGSLQSGRQSIYGSLKRKGIKSASNFRLSDDTLDNRVIEYPELIYDGPFSDAGEQCFKALEKLETISQSEAIAIAKELFNDLGIKNVKFLSKSTRPDAFELGADITGGSIYCSISEKGGKLISATTDRAMSLSPLTRSSRSAKAGEASGTRLEYAISKERAKELALEYAERCEYCNDLTPVWYNSIEGTAYINLAPSIDGIIYYPDLVKVKISLEDGKLIALEATGFCANNCCRALTPTIDEKTAKSSVSPKLEISAARLAVIPLEGKLARGACEKELLCYEIICSYNGLDYFVYIDATTAKEVNILRVVNEQQGEMVL